ncbi:crotonobetainyl-CoA--carnitine CoA-transferase [Hydrogenophaga sp. BPS33]|uniref:crotonobetainyl-CoA--carnitine CoA-transferase n=1 Tax=Hydrogenophaga sp. BPS33 TaxID=2651974 RepID=UPI0013203305|nr:crotonobetainyl-CoA--carnitine CoA-transferase [Hydrogenophaga sp. BPS33]QHE83767.1 crotonobetainyl-CoA--carnitine CoA-transferase [Hydrogenophaga sp. BPS33]
MGSTSAELDNKLGFAQRLRTSAIPNTELLDNLGVYLTRQTLSRINFIQSLYQKIVPVHGVIMEFGVRWGQNMALFSQLRGIHEPFNYNRRIVGFDTFEGFPSVSPEDGTLITAGDYSVAPGWKDELDAILSFHERNAPIPHKRKYELVEGDANVTLPAYLEKHPETIVALAYFDFDIYAPTKSCLERILPHLTKGSVLAFDELNCPEFPGETLALREVLGLSKYAIRRDPSNPLTSYLVIE